MFRKIEMMKLSRRCNILFYLGGWHVIDACNDIFSISILFVMCNTIRLVILWVVLSEKKGVQFNLKYLSHAVNIMTHNKTHNLIFIFQDVGKVNNCFNFFFFVKYIMLWCLMHCFHYLLLLALYLHCSVYY